jgi:hypothetical protein
VTDHYRFVLTAPEVDGILCSPLSPDEVRGIARALAEGPLTEEEQAYLVDLAALADGRATLLDG